MDLNDKSIRDALEYLFSDGTPLLKGYANVLLNTSSVDSLERWIRDKTPKFSFSETVEALEILDSLAYQDCPAGELAITRIVELQDEDGGWGKQLSMNDRLSLTGQVAGLLAKSPFSPGRSLRAADSFFEDHWSEKRVRSGSLVDIDVYFHWLANYPGELADEALQWCGRELTRGFRSGNFGPLATGRIFVRCGARALPGASVSSREVCEKLIKTQRQDGSFFEPYIGSEVASTGVALSIFFNLS